jgi:hypothetical protein
MENFAFVLVMIFLFVTGWITVRTVWEALVTLYTGLDELDRAEAYDRKMKGR